MTQVHVEPSLLHQIKGKYYGKSDKGFVTQKLHRDTTSSTLEIYEYKMSLFDNGDPEEFCWSCITST